MLTLKQTIVFALLAIALAFTFPLEAGMVTSSYKPNESKICGQARKDIFRWQAKILEEESNEKPDLIKIKRMESVQKTYFDKYKFYCEDNKTSEKIYRQRNESEGDLNGLESN